MPEGSGNNPNLGDLHLEELFTEDPENEGMTTEEKVDNTLDSAGSEMMQKVGVPKELADYAVKKSLLPTDRTLAAKVSKKLSRKALANAVDEVNGAKSKFKPSGNNSSKPKDDDTNKNNDKKTKESNSIGKKAVSNAAGAGTNPIEGAKGKKSGLPSKPGIENPLKGDNKGKEKDNSNKSNILSAIKKKKAEANKNASVKAAMALVNAKLKKIKIYAVLILVCLVALALLVGAVMGFIIDSMAVLDEAATNVANDVEKFNNFMNGMGFQNSEDAFYDELNYQNRKYDYQLDIPMIMATIFYDDMHSNGTLGMEDLTGVSEDESDNPTVAMSLIKKLVKDKVKEANVTIGADGLEYSANKIYRLRKLAKNSFDTNLFGVSKNKTTKEVYLLDYVEHNKEQFDDETYRILVDMFRDPISILTLYTKLDSLVDFLSGEETWDTTTVGSILEDNSWTHRYELLKHIIGSFADVKRIGICKNPTPYNNYNLGGAQSETPENDEPDDNFIKNKLTSFCVEYYVPVVSEENYFNYLKNYYIKRMPEFKKYISSTNDEARDKEIDKIIDEIKRVKEDFANIFPMQYVTTTENYSQSCTGNIKQSLVNELEKPIETSSSYNFSGENAYGASGGSMHNGVDLNETSAGVTEGADVYSVYDNGEVIESTADKSYSDKNVKGGWVKIKYTSSSGEEAYYFTIIYGGLSKSSLTLKKGDVVTKKQVIGKIGNKDESEDGKTLGLHFGFYDDTSKAYLDPTNIFIPCTGASGTTCATYYMHDKYSISQSDFVAATKEYCNTNDCGELGSWDFNVTFNTSVQNNLNPTYTVTRALKEGSSPGGSSYNYWGIGCYNGHSENCIYYSSFENGIIGLATLDIIVSSETLMDVFKQNYAYLGDYWMKVQYDSSGNINWSDGGCVYYPSIKEFMSPSRDAEVANICSDSNTCPSVNGGAGCVATIEEDHNAYREWQCKDQMEFYKNIYGNYIKAPQTADNSGGGTVDPSSSESGYPEGTYRLSSGVEFKQYRQDVGTWAGDAYWDGTIASDGCGPTSVAILASGLVDSNITPAKTTADMRSASNKTSYETLQVEMRNLGMTPTLIMPETEEDILNALKSGNVMLVSVDSPTIFTANSHIMTIVDYNEKGEVYIINPNSAGPSSSPSGWYSPSAVISDDPTRYIITTPIKRNVN